MELHSEVLLAPVPIAHISAARLVASQSGGKVAFGSGDPKAGGQMWEFFNALPQKTPALIYVSKTGMTEENKIEYVGLRFSYTAIFEGYEVDEAKIKRYRPSTALKGDTGHQLYWIVSDFRALDHGKQVSFAKAGIGEELLEPKLKKYK